MIGVFTLMAAGLGLSFYGSRAWGGTLDEGLVVLYALVVLGAVTAFLVADTRHTRVLAGGVLLGFWAGGADAARMGYCLAGIAAQFIALFWALRSEAKS